MRGTGLRGARRSFPPSSRPQHMALTDPALRSPPERGTLSVEQFPDMGIVEEQRGIKRNQPSCLPGDGRSRETPREV